MSFYVRHEANYEPGNQLLKRYSCRHGKLGTKQPRIGVQWEFPRLPAAVEDTLQDNLRWWGRWANPARDVSRRQNYKDWRVALKSEFKVKKVYLQSPQAEALEPQERPQVSNAKVAAHLESAIRAIWSQHRARPAPQKGFLFGGTIENREGQDSRSSRENNFLRAKAKHPAHFKFWVPTEAGQDRAREAKASPATLEMSCF